MKYYENLDPIERKKLVLRTVAFSSAMEGMSQAKQECLDELRALERKNTTVATRQPVVQKAG